MNDPPFVHVINTFTNLHENLPNVGIVNGKRFLLLNLLLYFCQVLVQIPFLCIVETEHKAGLSEISRVKVESIELNDVGVTRKYVQRSYFTENVMREAFSVTALLLTAFELLQCDNLKQ